jgi:hypothetical protein
MKQISKIKEFSVSIFKFIRFTNSNERRKKKIERIILE